MNFEITFLGVSAAMPAFGRNQTSQIIHHHHENYLVDCGEGTQLQLFKFYKKMSKIGHIFISHLHGDHYFGLVALLSSMNMNQRDTPLHLYAPAELAEILWVQNKVSGTFYHYPITFHEIDSTQSKTIYQNDFLTVQTIPLDHSLPCTGFLFQEKTRKKAIISEKLISQFSIADKVALKEGKDVIIGEKLYKNEDFTQEKRSRSYAFCSDTKYNERIVDQIKNVDVLYHEATFLNEKAAEATAKFHSTAAQAAQIAQKANVKKLFLGHYSARYKTLEGFLEESRTVFPNTFLSLEGETVEILDK